MSTSLSSFTGLFTRQTKLASNQKRVNFRQTDSDCATVVLSEAARAISQCMSQVYFSLVHCPHQFFESEGVLVFGSRSDTSGKTISTAWQTLMQLTHVSSATLKRCLDWLREQGVIGYFAGKNGAGIRIFLNRAKTSIRTHLTADAGQKNLSFAPVSLGAAPTSPPEAPFIGPTERDVLDIQGPAVAAPGARPTSPASDLAELAPATATASAEFDIGRLITDFQNRVVTATASEGERLKTELHRDAADLQNLVKHLVAGEFDRFRQWLKTAGLPLLARVATAETLRVQTGVPSHVPTSTPRQSDGSPRSSVAQPKRIEELQPDDIADAFTRSHLAAAQAGDDFARRVIRTYLNTELYGRGARPGA